MIFGGFLNLNDSTIFAIANIFPLLLCKPVLVNLHLRVCLHFTHKCCSLWAEISVCRHRTAFSVMGWLRCLDWPQPGVVWGSESSALYGALYVTEGQEVVLEVCHGTCGENLEPLAGLPWSTMGCSLSSQLLFLRHWIAPMGLAVAVWVLTLITWMKLAWLIGSLSSPSPFNTFCSLNGR